MVSLEVLIGGAHGSVSLLRALGEGGAGRGAGCFSSRCHVFLLMNPVLSAESTLWESVCQSDRPTVSQRDSNEGGDSESEAEVCFLSVPNKVSIGK